MQVIQTLQADGIDLIEVSGGNYENPSMVGANARESTLKREAYFLEYAEQAKQLLDIPLVVTGGFRSAPAMNDALGSGALDMIGLARPLAVDPAMSNKLLADDSYGMQLRNLTTGFPQLDFAAMLDITWYEQQLARIGAGKAPKPNLGAWSRNVMEGIQGLLTGRVLPGRRSNEWFGQMMGGPSPDGPGEV